MTQLRRIRAKHGLSSRAITSALQLPDFASREQLEQYRDVGLQEMERDGYSQNYLIYQEALRRGLDEQLPSLSEMHGMAGSFESVLQETEAAVRGAKQVFDPERLDPRLEGVEIMGVPVTEWPVHDLLDHLHAGVTEFADGPARDQVLDLIQAVHNSPYGSLTSSIEVSAPDPIRTYEVESDREGTGDPYVDWRNGALQQQSGLEGLMIGDGYNLDGLRNMGGGGGSYSVAHDAAYHQAMAEGDYDDE